MADYSGVSFTPGAQNRTTSNYPPGQPPGSPQGLSQALQVLSLRLPGFLGGDVAAPDALLRGRVNGFRPDQAIRGLVGGNVSVPRPPAPPVALPGANPSPVPSAPTPGYGGPVGNIATPGQFTPPSALAQTPDQGPGVAQAPGLTQFQFHGGSNRLGDLMGSLFGGGGSGGGGRNQV